jgi:hypothetical protein
MSDIIRLAKNLYGREYGRLADEASAVKAQYVAAGGEPADVYSPERIAALANGGPRELLAMKSKMRDDGSIAAPFVPTPLALDQNMIQKEAIPAVKSAMQSGIKTVSSGIDKQTGSGFAIGKDPNGNVVKVME